MDAKKLPDSFISHAAETLADTSNGLTGGQIIKYCNSYAVVFGVDIPITSPNFGEFGKIVPNKRTALYRNLVRFNGQQQFVILKELCELPMFENNSEVAALKKLLFERHSEFYVLPVFEQNAEPTGWIRVDHSIEEMKSRYKAADTEEKYQAIGMLGRETIISIAQQVFIKSKYPSTDGTDIGPTDAKRMLDAYITRELSDESEKIIKYAKSAVDMCNQLTHDRSATKRAAAICIVGVSSIAALIKEISETS